MKQFLLSNWYKLMIGSSLLMGSFGFMMYSVNSAFASQSNSDNYRNIPVNADDTISIRLTDDQLKLLTPKEIQPVDIVQVRGKDAAFVVTSPRYSEAVHALGTVVENPSQ